jgi:hypothetical protein
MIVRPEDMVEQYIHILIPADSAYAPDPEQVAVFFAELLKLSNFRLIKEGRFQQGLRVLKPSGRSREVTSPLTGETRRFPVPDSVKVNGPAEISALLEGLPEFSVRASGEWRLGIDMPIMLYTMDEVPYRANYLCEVSCQLHPVPVSMSTANGARDVLDFGEPCSSKKEVGHFLNPWTGEPVEVAGTGCARFWIEFEFGKFIYPKIAGNFDVLNPSLVGIAEESFRTKFAQGCRFC